MPRSDQKIVVAGSSGGDSLDQFQASDPNNPFGYVFLGFDGNDFILGSNSDDIINGGSGVDYMVGGFGNDYYIVDNENDVVVESLGGGTKDTVQSSAASYTLADNVERMILLEGAGDINGHGNGLDNLIMGNSQNNVISGEAGNDVLDGQAGDDTLNGGTGDDFMGGGKGDDYYVVDSLGDQVFEKAGAGEGTKDTVQSSLASYTLGANVERLILAPGSSNINGHGNAEDNLMIGNDGNNVISGETGNDTLQGGGGDDVLNGGLGDDVMAGGDGNDLYIVDSFGDVVSEGSGLNSGTKDTVQSSISYTLTSNVEKLILIEPAAPVISALAAAPTLDGTGNGLDNFIIGSTGDNVLKGLVGNDTIEAGNGNDRLEGGVGNDVLSGQAGNDVIVGGAGNDMLYGGAGSDTFVFEAGFNLDRIFDFNGAAGDQIDLTAIGAGNFNVTQVGTYVSITDTFGDEVRVMNATVADVNAHIIA